MLTSRTQRYLQFALISAAAAIIFVGGDTGIPIASAQSEETFLSFVSEQGDYIGQGESRSFTPADSQFSSMVSQDRREIAVNVFPFAGGFWFLHLAAPSGQELVPGNYEGATRWPFQNPAVPGMDFSGDGRGCNMLTGRFQVLEALYHDFGYIERFHATFEQHCEGAEPALLGEIRIVNPPPPPPLTLGLTLDRKAEVQRVTGRVTLAGTVTCSIPTTVQISGTVTQRASRFVLVTGSFNAWVLCSPTPTQWSADVSTSGVPFNPGPAQVDASASAIDPNFNVPVTVEASGLVQLTRSRR
jgi:hypothetical protein